VVDDESDGIEIDIETESELEWRRQEPSRPWGAAATENNKHRRDGLARVAGTLKTTSVKPLHRNWYQPHGEPLTVSVRGEHYPSAGDKRRSTA
jgi:hypothetical protein